MLRRRMNCPAAREGIQRLGILKRPMHAMRCITAAATRLLLVFLQAETTKLFTAGTSDEVRVEEPQHVPVRAAQMDFELASHLRLACVKHLREDLAQTTHFSLCFVQHGTRSTQRAIGGKQVAAVTAVHVKAAH
eukprot:2342677-Pleurochrysis_carterae.AAC.5